MEGTSSEMEGSSSDDVSSQRNMDLDSVKNGHTNGEQSNISFRSESKLSHSSLYKHGEVRGLHLNVSSPESLECDSTVNTDGEISH